MMTMMIVCNVLTTMCSPSRIDDMFRGSYAMNRQMLSILNSAPPLISEFSRFTAPLPSGGNFATALDVIKRDLHQLSKWVLFST